jgi:hypothetical protein
MLLYEILAKTMQNEFCDMVNWQLYIYDGHDAFNWNYDFSFLSSWDVSLTHSRYIYFDTIFINVTAV